VIKVIQPVFLGKLIQYFEKYDPDNMDALYEAFGYAAGVCLSTLILAVTHHLYFFHVQRTGMKMRVAMCHMIYKKVSIRDTCLQTFFYFFTCFFQGCV
jgi:ATP-binding cassette subfamily C (CFTR/MRP) protein 4